MQDFGDAAGTPEIDPELLPMWTSKLVRHLIEVGNRLALADALSHVRQLYADYGPDVVAGVRYMIPALMLRLGHYKGCYRYIQGRLAEHRVVRRILLQDALPGNRDPLVGDIEQSIGTPVQVGILVALALFKLKLLLDVRRIIASKDIFAQTTNLPKELSDMIYGSAVSEIILDFVIHENLTILLKPLLDLADRLQGQVQLLFYAVHSRNSPRDPRSYRLSEAGTTGCTQTRPCPVKMSQKAI